jgi:hypothetical protein
VVARVLLPRTVGDRAGARSAMVEA